MRYFSLFVLCLLASLGGRWQPLAAQSPEPSAIEPLVRVVDLDVGESSKVTLCDGSQATLKLVSLDEQRDKVRLAVRRAKLVLEVNGQRVELEAAPYRLPITAAGVQLDCSVTAGMNSNGTPEFWGLEKDARLRVWPADSPWITPGSFIYPLKQGWLATRTWFDNQAVDGGATILKKIYYHSGLDIGASEGLVEVIAATDALVVQRGTDVLEGHQQDTPASPRYDVVYLLDGRGWYYRYSHLKEIAPDILPGRVIRQGELVGLVGKEGASGGWSHLHFEIKSRQPSGKWGTQAGFAFLHQAYVEEFGLKMYALARPSHFLVAGEAAELDGSRSWTASGEPLQYEWTLHDGTKRAGAKTTVTYPTPGYWCETLQVTNAAGESDYDFVEVMVLDPGDLQHYTPSLNLNFHPSRDIQVEDEITFKVRSFRMVGGEESWDFGDGSPAQTTRSPEEAEPLAADGYAQLTHRYKKPGQYIVTVSRTHDNGQTATSKLCVTVEAKQ
ncbi:MAG: PKD domain-containing protein [Planctomycetales bacterium]|nr:PKD domain-containing protein [Planctomycetales bacterium]